MCTLALAFTAISTGVSLMSSLQQGQDQSAYYKYQGKQAAADANAEVSYAKIRADKIRKAGLLRQSEARASLAASGVDVDAGTSVEINRKIGENTEADALTEILDGTNKANKMRAQAAGYNMSASNASRSGNLNALSRLMGGSGTSSADDTNDTNDPTSLLSSGGKVAPGWKTAAKRTIN